MTRVLAGMFVIAHGAVTALIWSVPAEADAPFHATRSWLLGESRPLAVALAIAAAAAFAVAGVGITAHQTWWGCFGVTAGALALVLMVTYFNPWLIAGIAISAAILLSGYQQLQGA
jgi:hypothetical protein